MRAAGGLKLALKGSGHDDRRVRCAALSVAPAGSDERVRLVTDSRGRLRYRLPPGEYELRLENGGATGFAVGEQGWTTVRLQLR